MSEILKIYHQLNLIDVLASHIDVSTSNIRSLETEHSDANQSNAIISNAEFHLFDKNMRNFIFTKQLIEIDLKIYINFCFKTYYQYSVYNHDLYIVMTDNFENFNIKI